jgi:hypothetical protein
MSVSPIDKVTAAAMLLDTSLDNWRIFVNAEMKFAGGRNIAMKVPPHLMEGQD